MHQTCIIQEYSTIRLPSNRIFFLICKFYPCNLKKQNKDRLKHNAGTSCLNQ